MKPKAKRVIWAAAIAVAVAVAAVAACDLGVSWSARGRCWDEAVQVPQRRVGLVLGTSPVSTWNGRRNRYFDFRIKAAAELYAAGRVDSLIVSGGDYRSEGGYDEPVAMRDSLIMQGVDSARIILDYDGTNTMWSIAKVRDVYATDSIVIISQEYHNERALYLADRMGIDAIALNATTPSKRDTWLRNRARECLARVKAIISPLAEHPK